MWGSGRPASGMDQPPNRSRVHTRSAVKGGARGCSPQRRRRRPGGWHWPPKPSAELPGTRGPLTRPCRGAQVEEREPGQGCAREDCPCSGQSNAHGAEPNFGLHAQHHGCSKQLRVRLKAATCEWQGLCASCATPNVPLLLWPSCTARSLSAPASSAGTPIQSAGGPAAQRPRPASRKCKGQGPPQQRPPRTRSPREPPSSRRHGQAGSGGEGGLAHAGARGWRRLASGGGERQQESGSERVLAFAQTANHLPLKLQVHRSKVATLALAPGGAALWCGCDAAAPRPRPLDSGAEPPVVLVDCSVGGVDG